jgi:hypothetical protein
VFSTLAEPPSDEDQQRTATLVGTIVALVILIGAILLTRKLVSFVEIDNCIASGARNCVAIPGQPSRLSRP